MDLPNLVYSTDEDLQDKLIPVSYSKRADAPEQGTVFTAQAIKKEGKNDLIVDRFKNYCGYIKKNPEKKMALAPGEFYRFEIIAGPYTQNRHNYFYAIPLRELSAEENSGLNKLDPQTYILIKRLGEFLLGLGWNRKQKRHYKLSKAQDLTWFLKTFNVY